MTVCKSEKQRAFEHEALDYADMLFRFGLRLTRNAQDADDLVQDTYLRAYRFWDKYNHGTNLRAWLFRILKNSFINLYRKKSREPEKVSYSEEIGNASVHPGSAYADNLQELEFHHLLDDDVWVALLDLPEDYRTAVILCDIEGLPYAEIARFVRCPVGTVRSRIHRGRKILSTRLLGYAKERGYVHPPGSDVQIALAA